MLLALCEGFLIQYLALLIYYINVYSVRLIFILHSYHIYVASIIFYTDTNWHYPWHRIKMAEMQKQTESCKGEEYVSVCTTSAIFKGESLPSVIVVYH